MATTKSNPKLLKPGSWHPSLRKLLIAASFALNIGFVVILITLSTSNVLDGVFMGVGLERYCSADNDDKFVTDGPKTKALRTYVCDRSDAQPFFRGGLNKYYDSLYIPNAGDGVAEPAEPVEAVEPAE